MLDRVKPVNRPASSVIEGGAAEALNEIRAPGCAAAIWHRRLDEPFRSWLDALPPERLPGLRAEARMEEAARLVHRACREVGLPHCAGRAYLAEDVERLAARFARIMRTRALRIRLDVVDGDGCRKFHQDHVPARLLCAYRGAGPEYGLAAPGKTPADIRRMETGWVGLFRGRLWPGGEPCGLLHRSPPIAGSGETRLLLVIDVADRS